MPRNLLLLLPALAAGFRTVPSPSQRGQVRLMMAASELGKPTAGPATAAAGLPTRGQLPRAPPPPAAPPSEAQKREKSDKARVLLDMALEEAADAPFDEAACAAFFARTADAWPRASAMLDVRAALAAGELDPRVAFPEGVARGEVAALEAAAGALARGELDVRRRYRGASAREMLPRWRAVRKRRRLALALTARSLAQPEGKDLWALALARAGGETTTLGPVFSRVERAEDRWACAALCDVIESEIALRMLDERARTREALHDVARAHLAAQNVEVAACAERFGLAHGADEEAVLDKYVEEAAKRFRFFNRARDALPAALGVLAVAWAVAAFEQVQQHVLAVGDAQLYVDAFFAR